MPAPIEGWEVLDLLASLVQKSLVLYEEDEQGRGRYRLLETVGQYAGDRLREAGEAESAGRRHMTWCLEFAERAERELWGTQQTAWQERLATERDNLRAALQWLEERGEAEAGLRLCAALCLFWARGGCHTEGRERLARLLALPGASAHTAARAKALYVGGVLAQYQGDYAAARLQLEESAALGRERGDQPLLADVISTLGHIAHVQGDYAAARSLYEQSLALRRELGISQDIAISLRSLADLAANQGDDAAARPLYEESLAIARQQDDAHSIASVMVNLGEVARRQGDVAAARSLIEESLRIFQALDDRQCLPRSLSGLARLACGQGDYGAARARYAESLAILRERGAKRGVPECLEGLAEVAARGDREPASARGERAARLLAAAAALRETLGAALPPPYRDDYERSVAAARAALGSERFAAAWAQGRAMSLPQAIEYALQPEGTAAGE